MRVISIIVRLIALCDPALHKSPEDEQHLSLHNKCGVNFASLLSPPFLLRSLEPFLLPTQRHGTSVSVPPGMLEA